MLRRSLDTSRSNGCKTNFSFRNLRSKQVSPMHFADSANINRGDDEEVSSLSSRCSALRMCAIVKIDLTNGTERFTDEPEPEPETETETEVECDCDGESELTTYLRDCDSAPPRSLSQSHSALSRDRTQRGILTPTEALKKNRRKAIPPRNTRIRSKVNGNVNTITTIVSRSRSCTLNNNDVPLLNTTNDIPLLNTTNDIHLLNTTNDSSSPFIPPSESASSPSILSSPNSSSASSFSLKSSALHSQSCTHLQTQPRSRMCHSLLRRSVDTHTERENYTESENYTERENLTESESESDSLTNSTSSFPIFNNNIKQSVGLKNDGNLAGTSPVMVSPIGSPMVAVNHGPFRHTLVLDIDETLVHCAHEKIDDADLYFEVFIDGKVFPIYCLLRPLLYEFLDTVSSLFHVVAFTASLRDYADQLLDRIDPENRYFRGRYFRESCGENFCKNLLAVQSDLSSICIVDNMAQAYGLQPANGIDISSWYSDRSDTALRDLIPFLATLTFFPDVRVPIRQRQMQQLKIACNGGTGNLFYPNSTTYSPLPASRRYQIDTTSSSLIASAREVEADCTKRREDDIDLLIDEFGSEECVL